MHDVQAGIDCLADGARGRVLQKPGEQAAVALGCDGS